MSVLLDELLVFLTKTPRPIDKALVTKAWNFADTAHTGQKRLSGEPFISHPTHVAITLAGWNMDTTSIVAGLLHDTVEDGGATREDLQAEFGPEVAQLVEGVTKITGVHLTGHGQEEFVENLRKMLLVMAKDLRVIFVKLADRLHNMQTLQFISPKSQVENSKETLEIYAPLAERLGMGDIKSQLEDLAFPYVYPDDYTKLATETKSLYEQSSRYLEKFRRDLASLLVPQIPTLVITIRQKHLYSLFRKLQRSEIAGDISKTHDLVAARIITDSVEQCYKSLGLIHGKYHPVPYLGIRDYIATPKSNGYQSIHTNVFGPEGKIVEIQIRTQSMHDFAEMGVAAHWQLSQLKSAGKLSSVDIDTGNFQVPKKLDWVKQLASWQKEVTNNEEYLHSLKFDALSQRILVFSPMGDVYELAASSTPIDFAYAVHTDLGHQAVGAKVNTKLVGLNYKLNNSDLVEILIDRKRKLPSHEWLDFVVTHTARREIQKALKI